MIHEKPCKPYASFIDENEILITDRMKIANTLGTAIEKYSSSKNNSKGFELIKAQNENQKNNL